MERLSKIIDAGQGWVLRTNSLNLQMWNALVKAGFQTTHFIAEPSALGGDDSTMLLESAPKKPSTEASTPKPEAPTPEGTTNEQTDHAEGNADEARTMDMINHAKSLGLPISAVPDPDLDEDDRRGLLKEFLNVFTPLAISKPQKPLALAKIDNADDAKKESSHDGPFGRHCPVTYYESGLLLEGERHLSAS